MLIEQPPGVRATKKRGEWCFARGTTGSNFVMNDFSALEARLGNHVFAVVRSEIFFKMRRAELGRLTYGPDRDTDVMQMVVAKDVLEIRLSDSAGDEGELQMRFFYSEPLDRPTMLCGLGLLWKRPGLIGVEEQTAFAQRCSVRLAEFSRRDDY